ncbi:MAG: TrgA family protein [Rhodobacteraceae bacterium]|nr:TrgA family protein [Paracoccaceae bacterium]
MPTMPKLIAAILVAALGYVAADRVAGHLPPETPSGILRELVAFFGLMVGWRFLGRRVGDGLSQGLGVGLSAVALLVLISLIWFSGYEMIRRAMRMAYGGNPFAALQDMMQIAIKQSVYLAHADVIGVLVLGGIVVGVLVELAARRWS